MSLLWTLAMEQWSPAMKSASMPNDPAHRRSPRTAVSPNESLRPARAQARHRWRDGFRTTQTKGESTLRLCTDRATVPTRSGPKGGVPALGTDGATVSARHKPKGGVPALEDAKAGAPPLLGLLVRGQEGQVDLADSASAAGAPNKKFK